MEPHAPYVVVDACCWIDLFATGRIEEILRALPYRLAVPRYVAEEEVLTTLGTSGAEERCDFGPLTAADTGGLVWVWDLETASEKEELVRFAAHLDEGEAAVCALAVARGATVATDDRKAIKILARFAPDIQVLETPDLLHTWAEIAHPTPAQRREVLRAIEVRARFSPRRGAPFAEWWSRSCRESAE